MSRWDLYQEPQGESKSELIEKIDRMKMRRNALRRDLEELEDDIQDAEEELFQTEMR